MSILPKQICTNFIVNVSYDLHDTRQVIEARENCGATSVEEMRQVLVELKEALKSIPEQQVNDAEAVSQQVRRLVEDAGAPNPNRSLLSITKDGMIKAAETLVGVVPKVLPLAKKLAELIAP